MKYFLFTILLFGSFAAGWFTKPMPDKPEMKSSDTTYVRDTIIPPPVIKWLKPVKTTSITPFQDTVYIPVFDTIGIDKDFFINDSLYWFNVDAIFDRDGDSIAIETVMIPNAYVPDLELKVVQRAEWNKQTYKIVTNNLILPKPLPFVQLKPAITIGIDMRGKPNAVAGAGITFNF